MGTSAARRTGGVARGAVVVGSEVEADVDGALGCESSKLITIRSAFGGAGDGTNGVGTNTVAPHVLHLPFLPAVSSPTEKDLPHLVQEKVIIAASKLYFQ